MNSTFTVLTDEKSGLYTLCKNGMPCACPFLPPMPVGQNKLSGEIQFQRISCTTACLHADILVIPAENGSENIPDEVVYSVSCGCGNNFDISPAHVEKAPETSTIIH